MVAGGIPLPEGKYRVFYADPPWAYGNTMSDNFTEQRDHYRVLAVREQAAQSHLFSGQSTFPFLPHQQAAQQERRAYRTLVHTPGER